MITTHENEAAYKYLFDWTMTFNLDGPSMLMADAAYPISNAAESSFGDECNRLMCHIHVNRNIKKKAGGIRSEAVF